MLVALVFASVGGADVPAPWLKCYVARSRFIKVFFGPFDRSFGFGCFHFKSNIIDPGGQKLLEAPVAFGRPTADSTAATGPAHPFPARSPDSVPGGIWATEFCCIMIPVEQLFAH